MDEFRETDGKFAKEVVKAAKVRDLTEHFQHCCLMIEHCPRANEYARSYAKAGRKMNNPKYIRDQCLYILNNIVHWRSDYSTQIRNEIKALAKLETWE